MPAVPARVRAELLPSVARALTTPLTEAVSCTGFALLTEREIVAQLERSAIPLAASASTVVVLPLSRRIWRFPLESSATA